MLVLRAKLRSRKHAMTVAQYFRFLAALGMTVLRWPDRSCNPNLHTPDQRRTGERCREGVSPHLSVRYTYRMSKIPYSVGVVLPKIFLTALSRSESVV